MECEAKATGLQKDKDGAQKNAATFMQKASELQGELRVLRALFKGIHLAPHQDSVSRSPSVLTQRDPNDHSTTVSQSPGYADVNSSQPRNHYQKFNAGICITDKYISNL